MNESALEPVRNTLASIRAQGLYKTERIIDSPQDAHIKVGGKTVLNFCANNYLGLANHPKVKEAAKRAIDEYGMGLASVRFICGTQTIHKRLEEKIARFYQTDDTIIYSSCFDANGGLFETILGEDDAVVSDSLNHASIIDGIRLCKAKRFRYEHCDLQDLRTQLQAARDAGARTILVATDGVFSMDGHIAPLGRICSIAREYGALTMVDDCHATGFLGRTGRGSLEHCGVLGQIDIVTSTLGKALGGAAGGFTTGRREVIELLRQRSRPYLFSNSLAPALVAAGDACLDLIDAQSHLRERLAENAAYFRSELSKAGFTLLEGNHPIIPIMLGDARHAVSLAEGLLSEGIYVIAFSYPVVPQGKARIRTQMSAAHSRGDVEAAVAAFTKVARALSLI